MTVLVGLTHCSYLVLESFVLGERESLGEIEEVCLVVPLRDKG